MGNLIKKLKDIELRFIGNKVNLLGSSALILGLVHGTVKGLVSIVDHSPDISLGGELALSYSVAGFGLFLSHYCNWGEATARYYRLAKRHIKTFGELNEAFVRRVFDRYDTRRFYGYCSLQGVFIAAREHGLTEEFLRMKREHSENLVPHF